MMKLSVLTIIKKDIGRKEQNSFRILDSTDKYNNIIEKIILLIIDLGDQNILNIIYDESKKTFENSLNYIKKLELLQKINNYISKTIKNTKIFLLDHKIYSCLYSITYNIIYDKSNHQH